MSKDAGEYGEEDQLLRWTRYWKNLEKRERKYHPFEGGEK
jgi:hypothetical protein